ncbi:MAG TPA: TIR domain-containing protein [Saprospiraceae bacterium]|nr:TIR domain-containing protein [Saprospiraceae bacterium]
MSMPLKIFIIYAREDKAYKDDLLKSLKLLQTQGLIEPWHDSDIKPGDEWDKEIKARLRAADIILPIISFDFFNSDYIHRVEIVEAFERYDRGEALIIPIIADSCPWTDYPRLKDFQALPAEGRAIDDWPDRKKAMSSIYEGVKRIIEEKRRIQKEEEKKKEAHRKKEEEDSLKIKQEEKKRLEEERIRREAAEERSKSAKGWCMNGIACSAFGKYGQAKYKFNQAIMLDPKLASAYYYRGIANEKLGYYSEARWDYQKTLSIDPNYEDAKNNLKNLEEKMNKKRWFWE